MDVELKQRQKVLLKSATRELRYVIIQNRFQHRIRSMENIKVIRAPSRFHSYNLESRVGRVTSSTRDSNIKVFSLSKNTIFN